MSERLLDNRIALVTGAASGIGRSIAERLAMSGATIIVTDIDEKAASSVARNLGPDAWSARLDVRSRPHTDALVEAIALRHGRLDILVNNAGLVRDAAVHKMSDEEWDDVDAVILRGAFALTRSCAGLLRPVPEDGHHRKVINIASVSGIYGRELSANYCAAKAGLIGFTKALSREWARKMINVNAVAPGFIGGTRLTSPSEDGKASMKADFLERIEAEIPIGRGGRPQDVAALVGFLASSDADYITGQVIEVHGGLEILRVQAP